MKKRQVIALCILVALAIVVATCALRRHEPVYQGKVLSVWLREASTGTWPRPTPVPADEAIRQIGTNGFPIIVQLLRSRDSVLKSRLLTLYYKQSLIQIPVPTQTARHSCAFAACWAFGSQAKPLIPEVAKALAHMDPYYRPAFDNWLQSLGPDADAAVPALITILNDRSNPTRCVAAQTL